MTRIPALALAGVLFAGTVGEIQSQTFVRRPYLQLGSPTKASVCWRVNTAAALTVRFGTDSTNLNRLSAPSAESVNACVELDSLQPKTKYHYQVYNGITPVPGGSHQYLVTHPVPGSRQKHSFWVIGDFGTGLVPAQRVRNSYVSMNGGNHTDGVLMLGDNAYESGTDTEITTGIFSTYPDILSNSFAWPAIGNHDSPNIGAYLAAWSLPSQGQSGGVASNVEHYYSFNYGNIHFIILDSEISSRSPTAAQYQWLLQDLQSAAAQQADWIVAYYHHPAYTCCYHNSETEQKHIDLRWNLLPLMDQYGVDLHLSGHSHNYERTWLLDSAYGAGASTGQTAHYNWFAANRARIIKDSASGNPDSTGPYRKIKAGNRGAVHAVVGSSGKINTSTGQQPLVRVKIVRYGSMILDVEDSVLTGRWFDSARVMMDKFRIVKTLPPVGLMEGNDRSGAARPRTGAQFTQAGRRFQFASDNAAAMRLYSVEGGLLLQEIPRGAWEPDRKALPAGEYYYRHGGAFGKVSLP